MKKYRVKYIVLIIVMFASISSFFFYSKTKNQKTLQDFKILNVEELDGTLTVICEQNQDASKYQVTVTDEFDNKIYENSNSSNRIDLSGLQMSYNQTVYVTVTAKNDHSQKDSANIFEYTSTSPSFSKTNTNIISKENDLYLNVDGNISEKEYTLRLKHRDLTLYSTRITSNNIKINYDYLKGYSGRIVASIENNEKQILNEFNLYINPVVVSDIFITSPTEDFSTNLTDISITYTGGENATEIYLNVYQNNKLIKTIPTTSKKLTIPSDTFKTNTEYTLKLFAVYQDYIELAKTAELKVFIEEQLQTKPVTINHNHHNLKYGTSLMLSTRTNGATIKYTTDGKDPVKHGSIYKNPIIVTKNMTLKAVAIKENQKNSIITTYQLHIGHKTPTIYLSPSNQTGNKGVLAVGYTNEKIEMNKVTDYIEERLKSSGIKVYRNNPTDTMTTWIDQSLKVDADLHFAIHSNGSKNHDTKGMEIFVDDQTSPVLSIATEMYENLYAIYPNKGLTTDRGVKYAEGSLGEVRSSNLTNGILIEIAYHDYEEDAKWLVAKQKEIGYNIADTIINYYQMN